MISCHRPIRLGFFEQYLWKETTDFLNFLQEDSKQGKITCKTNADGWMWLVVPGMNLVVGGLVTLEVIHNEILIIPRGGGSVSL